jgi:hypothetical protein
LNDCGNGQGKWWATHSGKLFEHKWFKRQFKDYNQS